VSSRRTYDSRRVNSWRRSYVPKISGENLDTSEKISRKNCYKICKVQWSNYTEEEATWEKDDQLKVEFPDIFFNLSNSQGRDSS
jgi:hypothetical protein